MEKTVDYSTFSQEGIQDNEEVLKKVKNILTEYLESNKLRKTPERFAILEEIYLNRGHFKAETLHHYIVHEKRFQVSRATVYNTLEILVDCGLVVKHQFGKNLAHYEKAYGYKQHDHLICTECNQVIEFCDPRIQNIQNTVSDLFSFQIETHSLIFYGSCNRQNCENKQKNTNDEF